MLAWIGSLIGGPVVNGLISAYKARLESQNSTDAKAADLAAAAIQAEIDQRRQISEMRKVEGAWGPIGLLVFGFGLVVLIYFGKVIVWDIVLGLGSTDVIKGAVAEWVNTVIMFLFGGATATSIARTVSARFGKR